MTTKTTKPYRYEWIRNAICSKCDGTGKLTWTDCDGGVCYRCKGEGKTKTLTIVFDADVSEAQKKTIIASENARREKARSAKATAKRMAKLALEKRKAETAQTQFEALDPIRKDLYTYVNNCREHCDFVCWEYGEHTLSMLGFGAIRAVPWKNSNDQQWTEFQEADCSRWPDYKALIANAPSRQQQGAYQYTTQQVTGFVVDTFGSNTRWLVVITNLGIVLNVRDFRVKMKNSRDFPAVGDSISFTAKIQGLNTYNAAYDIRCFKPNTFIQSFWAKGSKGKLI